MYLTTTPPGMDCRQGGGGKISTQTQGAELGAPLASKPVLYTPDTPVDQSGGLEHHRTHLWQVADTRLHHGQRVIDVQAVQVHLDDGRLRPRVAAWSGINTQSMGWVLWERGANWKQSEATSEGVRRKGLVVA